MRYDPKVGPDPTAWLRLDEGEQHAAVLSYHRRTKEKAGNMRVHAVVHAAVETQLANEHAGAAAALERLLADGLDRHEAVHAIGTVVAGQIYRGLQGNEFGADEYNRELAGLSAESWRSMLEEE